MPILFEILKLKSLKKKFEKKGLLIMNRKLNFLKEKMYKTFEAKTIIKLDQTNNKRFNYVKS